MTDSTIPLIFWNLLLLSLFHSAIAGLLAFSLMRSRTSRGGLSLPSVTVLLCMRESSTPNLACLQGLLTLDYPRYTIQIVTERIQDQDHVVRFCQNYPDVPVNICALEVWHKTCSFEGSALIQTVRQLSQPSEVVAMIDASLQPHPNWLTELVRPLADTRVGVTTGYRWYPPVKGGLQALLRYAWNGFMVVQMCLSRVPWEGSFALRTAQIHQIDLVNTWQKSVTTDVILSTLLRRQGLEVRVVPSLFMAQHHHSDLYSFVDWVKRRLLLLRVYHPLWLLVAAQGIFVTATLTRAFVKLVSALFLGDWSASYWVLCGFAVYMGVVAVLISIPERYARQAAKQRGESKNLIPLLLLPKILLAIPLAQLLHAVTTISILFVRRLTLQDNAFPIQELRRI